MDVQFSEADLAFQQEVRDFIQKNWTEIRGGNMWEARGRWLKALREKGWDVPKWPVEFGGTGWTTSQQYIWDKESALASTPGVLPFGISMLAPILYTYGTKEQQDRFLPGIRNHTVNWCQGYSEPGAGSDLAAVKTRAVLSEDGSHYAVTGTKIWTTLAHFAHWMFCLTRTSDTGPKQEGITFLLIDMKTPGIEVKPIITLGGSHSVNMVHLDDVKVPVENRIGEEGKGWTYAKGLLKHERMGLAGVVRASASLRQLKKNAQSVETEDGTLMDNDAFAAKVAGVEIELTALEFAELRVLATVSRGGAPGPESSILKLRGTAIQQRLTELNLEVAGEQGAAWGGARVGPKFARQAMAGYLGGRATTIYGGASEVQKDVIAKNVFHI